MPRYVLLEHVAAPDDPAGLHYDLLLEDGPTCRTWRLSGIPRACGEAVGAREIARHRLAWLDTVEGEVSGGRGRIRRIAGGACEPGDDGSLRFRSGPLAGRLVFEGDACRIVS
jgi:hypothetical protein